MTLKKFYYLLSVLLVGSTLLFVSCNKDDDEEELLGDWEKMFAFEGGARSEAVGFVIGDNAYIATGYKDDLKERTNDLWVYNSKYWEQKASMPAGAGNRSAAVAFSAGGKGYVGTGISSSGDNLNDFWSYNPSTGLWSGVASFPGGARRSAVAFSIADKGYVGTGYDGSTDKADFYEYAPSSDSWVKVGSIGDPINNSVVFVIGTEAFLVTGMENKEYLRTMYAFNSTTKEWSKRRDIIDSNKDEKYDDNYTSIVRTGAVAFTIKGKGYLATGSSTSANNTVWEYDPGTDLWKEKTSFERASRSEAVGFALGNYGYVVTGRSGNNTPLYDLVRFNPEAERIDLN